MERSEPNGLPPTEDASHDRRRGSRSRVSMAALIVFRDGFCTMGCRILNTSDTGALLKPGNIASCPTKFVLKPRFDPPRDCEVVWRNDKLLGVRYL